MRPNATRWLCFSLLVSPGWVGLVPAIAEAQVTIDGTLNTSVTSPNDLDFDITNGNIVGRNLFHSFGEFSVPTNGSATFDLTTTPDISTIFSRITGPNASSIDGLIQTRNSANPVSLFLLNPQGILFGPNASLNIGGSFFATTATTIKFADGNTFSTTGAAPLLTMSVPIGLQMGQTPGPINQQAANLEVAPGQTIGLVGGGVTIAGGGLLAPAGRITIGSIGADGSVELSPAGALVDRLTGPMQDVQIQEGATIDVSGPGGGSVQVQGRQIQLNDGATIVSNTLGANNGGNIRINASDRLELSGTTSDEGTATNITARARTGSTGQGSSITIVAPQLEIRGGAQIVSRTDSKGNAGNISVQAQDVVAIGESAPDQNFPSGIISRTEATATGKGGDVTIATETIQILDGAEFRASSRGAGQGGNFTVRARSLTTNTTPSTASLTGISTSTRGGTGNGGSILLEVDDLNILGGSAIRTGSTAGNAGNIRIRAQQITLQGEDVDGYRAQLFTTTGAPGQGNAGNIQIDTDTLRLLDGSIIYANTSGPGNAGNILINANNIAIAGTESSKQFPSLLQTAVSQTATGNGGQITINIRDRIQLADGGQIVVSTFGAGNAGDIQLDAGTIVVTGMTTNGKLSSGIYASSENLLINGVNGSETIRRTTGNGGNITIRADQLRVEDGARITSDTAGDGDAGNIRVTARKLEVSGSRFSIADNRERMSTLSSNVNPTSTGQGGQIAVVADQVQLSNGGVISASTLGSGNSGGIVIQANNIDLIGKSLLGDRNSGIFSGSQLGTGNAGTIDLTVRDRLFADTGVISTQTMDGQGGMITIAADRVELVNRSGIDSSTSGNGKAGNVILRSGNINLNDSQITSRSSGTGDGGSIDLTAQTLQLTNAALNAQTTSGNGGNLNLNLRDLLQLRDRSVLSAAAGGNGNGGNIRLSAPFIIGLRNSDIVANAIAGNGGNIQITTDGIFGLKYRPDRTIDNDITASSEFGMNGNVKVQVLSIDPTSGLAALPIDVVDRSSQIDNQCNGSQGGSFVTTGRGGLPENPMQTVQSAAIWQDRRSMIAGPGMVARSPVGRSIVEATDWRQGVGGQVELVARSTNSGRSRFQASCAIAGVGAKHSAGR
jgi:filamentous hemagglutinin family protein